MLFIDEEYGWNDDHAFLPLGDNFPSQKVVSQASDACLFWAMMDMLQDEIPDLHVSSKDVFLIYMKHFLDGDEVYGGFSVSWNLVDPEGFLQTIQSMCPSANLLDYKVRVSDRPVYPAVLGLTDGESCRYIYIDKAEVAWSPYGISDKWLSDPTVTVKTSFRLRHCNLG